MLFHGYCTVKVVIFVGANEPLADAGRGLSVQLALQIAALNT